MIQGTTNLKNVKTISGPDENIDLIFETINYNPVSGEIVSFRRN